MSRKIIVALAVALSIIGSTNHAFADRKLAAGGDFTVELNFTTLALRPAGANCLLQVEGTVEFTGTLTGVAGGTTRALVLGSCEEASASPPGTFKDVFRSDLEFLGTLAGEPVIADLDYRGVTEAGGTITGLLRFSDGLRGVLKVNAVVAVGGSYHGVVFTAGPA